MMRPLRLSDFTLQKLSQNTVRDLGRIPITRRANAAAHTGMQVPAWAHESGKDASEDCVSLHKVKVVA